MKFIGYLKNSLKDFFIYSGFLMILITTISAIYSKETIETSQLFQIMLFSLAYVFFKLAFINKNDINKKVRLITFNVFLTLSELMILLWLLFFSPGKVMNINLLLAYIFALVIVKFLVYTMMSINGEKEAKLINEKLIKYKSEKD
jgi:Ca2+/Na+ antiporter